MRIIYQLISLGLRILSLTINVHRDERPHSLSKLNANVKMERTAITQEKIVTPLKKSAFESSAGVVVLSKYTTMDTHAANSNI